MGQVVVGLLAFYGQYVVSEIVVFIDDKIQREMKLVRNNAQAVEFRGSCVISFYPCHLFWTEKPLVVIHKRINHLTTVFVKVDDDVFCIFTHIGKIEGKHEILVTEGRRMALDMQTFEQLVKVVLLVDIVVGVQHAKEKALAETARTNEKEEVVYFQFLEIHAFVYKIPIFFS